MVGKKELFQFFKISPTPSLVLDLDEPKFTIIEVNEAYLDATNSTRSDLIGKGIFEAFPDNDSDPTADGVKNLSQSLRTVIRTNKKHQMGVQKYDIPIRGTSKFEVRYWQPENIPLQNDEGQLKYIIHCARDITEKVTAKKQVKEFEYFFNNSNDFSCIANKEGYFEITNHSFNRILGYTDDELTSKPFIDFIHPDDLVKTLEAYNQLKGGETIIHFTNRYRKKDGNYIWLDWNATPNLMTGKLYCIARDITERKRAEEALKLLNEELEQRVLERTLEVEKALKRFEYVTKATFDAIWDWNINEDFIFWGDGFEKIFGHKPFELKNNSAAWIENIHSEDIKRINESYYNIVKSTETNWIEEYRYRKSDGQYSYVINKGVVIRDNNGRAIRIIGAMQDITKKKEEELRLKLLESVVTNANDAVVIKEARPSSELGRKIVYVNESFSRMSGYSPDEIIGKTHKLLQGPNTDATELARFYKALDDWQPCEVTIINYNKNGEEYWVQLSLNPVTNAKGEYTHWISIERDVTERKLAEEESLKRLKEISDYKYAIDESSIVAITNQNGIITHVNDNFCKISKFSREELIGQDHRIINSGYHPKEFIKELWTTISNGKVWKGEIKNKAKDGSPYWVDTTIIPFLNVEGKPYQYVAIRADITERKKQEKELLVTTARLFDTLDSIQDGFYTLDSDWNVSYWNKEAERLSGRKHEDMIGKNFWDLYEGRISVKIHDAFYKAKFQNKPVRLEIYSRLLDYWFELNAFPSEMGLTVYFKNITDRKRTESKLKKINKSLENHVKELAISNEELEQFAYVASHDLQEPLRMVTSFLSQIEKKYENVLDEKGKKYIFFAVDGAKRMRQIILDLLEFSRVGKIETKLEEVDLNSIVEEVTFLYRKQIDDKNAQVQYDKLPVIRTHAAPIKQVFQNLISNSLKYSKPNQAPIIKISCCDNGSSWKFEIKDNGIGINQEYFDKIFIIFQRLHSKEEYSGTGMGLSITKKIIDNLRGHIWLESKPNQGTTFYFTIPKK